MHILNLDNSAYGLGQTVSRYLLPLLNSPRRPMLLKSLNALRSELERHRKRVTVRSVPFVLHIEPTNYCNLRCPNCVASSPKRRRPMGVLTLEQFQAVIDQLRRTLILARLDGAGESTLNRDIFSMIEYAAKRKVATAISTNLTTMARDDFGKMIDAGLDYLIISFDGITKATYEKVRVGANFEKVVASIRELVRVRRSRRSRTPFIEIQCIVFDENAHEVEGMKAFARSLGVDRLLVKEGRGHRILRVRQRGASRGLGDPCYWLWYVLNVSWCGDLKVCCTDGLESPFSFGNILERPVLQEWNNERMRAVRQLFVSRTAPLEEVLRGCGCLACCKLPLN